MSNRQMGNRKRLSFASTVVGVVLVLASTAAACVTFAGKVEVVGHDGKTEVVGTGNTHAYCSDGRPTTAAAGHLEDNLTINVKPGSCNDPGALANHQLHEGSYEVRYNNEVSYTYDGTYWTMTPGTGCFFPDNAGTTTIIGSLDVDAAGNGSWTGTLGALKQSPVYATQLTASNLCIGDPEGPRGAGGPFGNLMPYQLLSI